MILLFTSAIMLAFVKCRHKLERLPLFSQTGLGDTWAWSFSIWLLPIESLQVGFPYHQKISDSLIKSQPLPCTPACRHEFHALKFHPQPTFTTPLVRSTFRIQLNICGGALLQKQSTFLCCWLFSQRGSVNDVLQLLRLRFLPVRLHKGILNSSCLLILLINTNYKYNKM